ATWHSRDHYDRCFAIEEHLLDEVPETVRGDIILELEAHVLDELHRSEAGNRYAVCKMRLDIYDEKLPFREFLIDSCFFHRLDLIDIKHLSVDLVRCEEAGCKSHRAGHERAAIDTEFLRLLIGHLANQLLYVLLPRGLAPRD